MPFKHHASRHHKFAKSKHRARNWPEHTQSLHRHGDVTAWVDERVAHHCGLAHTGKRGRPRTYSDLAIMACLELRTIFHLALRQTQGFVRSLFRLMQLELAVPDFTTLSRPAGGLKPFPRARSKALGSLDLVVDSTGLKVIGAGEWQETKHGNTQRRRSWRTLHLGLDLVVLEIKAHGRMAWQKSTGYNQRARVETQMGRWKSVIGERLRSLTLDNQRTESRIAVFVLNKMISHGRPTFERNS